MLACIEIVTLLDLLCRLLLTLRVRMNLILENAGTRGLLYLIWISRGSLSLNFLVCIVARCFEPSLFSC